MKNNRITFIGTSNNKALRATQAGECSHTVNLQRHNDTLYPCSNYSPAASVWGDRDIRYIHACNTVRHIISAEGCSLYHESDIVGDDIIPINSLLITLDDAPCSICSLGNTLIVTTKKDVVYIAYRSDAYKVLGSKLPIPGIMFREKLVGTYSYDTPKERYIGCIDDPSETDFENFTNHIMGPIFKTRDEIHQNHAFFEPVMIRYALRMFDGSHIMPSPPILIGLYNYIDLLKDRYLRLDYYDTSDTTQLLSDYIVWGALGIEYIIDDTDLKDWKDIIVGIDIFVSKEIPLLLNETINNGIYEDIHNNKTQFRYKYKVPIQDSSFIEQHVFNETLFYYLTTIDSKDIVPYQVQLLKHDTNPTEIIYRPTLQVDTSSLATIGAQHTFVYNNRVHLADIFYSYFKGYNPMTFCTDCSENGSNAMMRICTQISNINGGTNEVATYMSVPFFNGRISPIISYPDSNATSMDIRIRYDGYEYHKTFVLKACDMENRATYVAPKAMNMDINEWDKTLLDIDNLEDFPTSSYTFSLNQRNKMIVSELNNPFLFPDELTYYISDGIINGIASTTAALSQGQFGEFPLYIFTNKGIWSMQQGNGAVCYSRCTPISNEISHEGALILPTDRAIIYLSGKNLSVITGSERKILLPLAELEPYNFNSTLPSLLKDIPAGLKDNTPILQYIDKDVMAAYNHTKEELILCNKKFSYCWILHIPSRHLYRWDIPLRAIIGNGEKLLAQSNNNIIYDLNKESKSISNILLITHPIQLAPDMYTRLRQVVWRMQTTHCVVSLYVFGAHEPDGTYKVIFHSAFEGESMGHLPLRIFSAPYKYYRLILSGIVSPDFTLDCADIAYDIVENNKLR